MQAQKNIRILNPYEKTQLARYKIPESEAQLHPTTPIEYLTGWVDFCAVSFQITPDTLIPRPESEELVSLALEWISTVPTTHACRVIDVGTGCGAIALSLARLTPRKISLRASDISVAALAIAQKNAQLMNQPDITWIEADVLAFLQPSEMVDLIIANLPYIPHERIEYLDSSVKDHEPRIALDGGDDGLLLIERLLQDAESHLSTNGTILLEIDYTHAETLRQRFSSKWKISTWQSKISSCTFAQLWLL